MPIILRPQTITRHDLKRWRTDVLGCTQQQAATYYGVYRGTWVRWESGTQPIPGWLSALVRDTDVASALGLDTLTHEARPSTKGP